MREKKITSFSSHILIPIKLTPTHIYPYTGCTKIKDHKYISNPIMDQYMEDVWEDPMDWQPTPPTPSYSAFPPTTTAFPPTTPAFPPTTPAFTTPTPTPSYSAFLPTIPGLYQQPSTPQFSQADRELLDWIAETSSQGYPGLSGGRKNRSSKYIVFKNKKK